MYAYCNNNPANMFDPTGKICATFLGDNHIFSSMFLTGSSRGGGGMTCASGGSRSYLDKLIHAEKAFFNNSDEEAVFRYLEHGGFAFYNGVPVFSADLGDGSAFSFGFIVMDDFYTSDTTGKNTIKHEYGHKLHMDEIGIINYAFTTAIPSLICAGLSNAKIIDIHYYSLPWECVADMYGGVNRTGYTQWADEAASVFWAYTVLVSTLTGGI
jgi:hypothetical protein